MNLPATVSLFAYGTSNGAQRAWDTRGRGRKEELSPRAQRALKSYVPMSSEKLFVAHMNEKAVNTALNGKLLSNRSPFDVVHGKIGIEVKTVFPGVKHSKVTQHPEARERKFTAMKEQGLKKAFTVIFDQRTNKIYVGEGLKSFRFDRSGVKEVKSISDLRRHLK